MKPIEFVHLAKYLIDKRPDEASLRTAVSRSYYSLHNALSDFIENEGIPLSKAGVRHEEVYRYLHNCGIEEIEIIAVKLDDLRGDRNQADYEMNSNKYQNVNTVTLLYLKAFKALQEFQAFINNRGNRKRIRDGINLYRRATHC